MSSLKQRDSKVIWHPFTPMKVAPEPIALSRGEGLYLIDEEGNRYIDAVSSWWVNLHGHAHPYISRMINAQMKELEHCMFAGFTHEPAIRLAERLIEILPEGMEKIFYSDNGSTAVEVAIKMSLQYWKNKGINRTRMVAIEGAYHGDTFGAMAVSARSIFTEAFTDYLFDVSFIPFPSPGNKQKSIAELKTLLKAGDVAALIVEPLVLGSGGMLMYDPEILEQYFGLCKKHQTIIIADEVMTGFGRTGTLFATNQVSTCPDIICLSKGLTGGFLPMGVTATTLDIFNAFYDDDRTKMLYHGHSYTANPTICAAALASMDLLLMDSCTQSRIDIENAHIHFKETISKHPLIKDIRHTGTILAIELKTDTTSYHNNLRDRIYNFFLSRKIILRPLGNIIYILPPYCITIGELEYIYQCIEDLLGELSFNQY